jgi:uncharacterized protein (TIGR00251 family)
MRGSQKTLDAAALDLRDGAAGVSLRVRVQPRASRDALGGLRDGALVVHVKAPPVEGAANDAVVRFLAGVLGRPASAVTLVRGAASKDKVVVVRGLTAAEIRALLSGAA